MPGAPRTDRTGLAWAGFPPESGSWPGVVGQGSDGGGQEHFAAGPQVVLGAPDCGLLANWTCDAFPPLTGAPENSSEPEGRPPGNGTELAPECTPEGLWCPRSNICLPLDTPGCPRACANGSALARGLPRASYALWKEFLFSVPPGPPAQYSVRVAGPGAVCFPSAPQGLGLPIKHGENAYSLAWPTGSLCPGPCPPLAVAEPFFISLHEKLLPQGLCTSCAF